MVRGIDSFREWFRGYEDQYVIIGGTACDLLMSDEGLGFRGTKDIDLVLIIEALDAEFGKSVWDYVKEAGYEHRNKSTGEPQFYRFMNPVSKEYPTMIELFTRKPESIVLPDDAVLSPLPVDESLSSLSAILLDDNYYEFLKRGRVRLTDVTILDAPYLIPFKAKAWLDLSAKKRSGEHVNSRDIRKHKNDVFRLSELLTPGMESIQDMPDSIKSDMKEFLDAMVSEEIDVSQLGIQDRSKEEIIEELRGIYTSSVTLSKE